MKWEFEIKFRTANLVPLILLYRIPPNELRTWQGNVQRFMWCKVRCLHGTIIILLSVSGGSRSEPTNKLPRGSDPRFAASRRSRTCLAPLSSCSQSSQLELILAMFPGFPCSKPFWSADSSTGGLCWSPLFFLDASTIQWRVTTSLWSGSTICAPHTCWRSLFFALIARGGR